MATTPIRQCIKALEDIKKDTIEQTGVYGALTLAIQELKKFLPIEANFAALLFDAGEDFQINKEVEGRFTPPNFEQYMRKNWSSDEQEDDEICCPSCKSNDTKIVERKENNGLIGAGFRRWVIDSYSCKNCGTRFDKIK